MTRYVAYNLSILSEGQAQSFLKDMEKKGYNIYYFVVTCRIMLVVFNIYTKKLEYVFDETMYLSFKESKKRLLNLLLPSDKITFKTPDIRIRI